MAIKQVARDILATVNQALGRPHNRTYAQINELKGQFVAETIDRERIEYVSRALAIRPEQVAKSVDDYTRQHADEASAEERWNQIGGSMMSLRDRLSLEALTKVFRPKMAIETGTAGGASATIILQNLTEDGKLVSIDIASPHSEKYGELIPDQLRSKWDLRLQENTPILPSTLAELEPIDFFLHDSRHTAGHMMWEYTLAWNSLCPGGCLASHDIVTTTTFQDFEKTCRSEIHDSGAIGNFGFFIKAGKRT